MSSINYSEKIPNNVNLSEDPELPAMVGRHGPGRFAEF